MRNTPVTVPPPLLAAAKAAEAKKAMDLKVLDLRGISSFTDYFFLCSGANTKQNQAISDAVGEELAKLGERPVSTEGYQSANWILMDYGDFCVHVFSDETREYYDLERLWGMADSLPIPTEELASA